MAFIWSPVMLLIKLYDWIIYPIIKSVGSFLCFLFHTKKWEYKKTHWYCKKCKTSRLTQGEHHEIF